MSALQPLTVHVGVAVPLMLANIDTDAIIPSREMKTVGRQGLGQALFAGWRYHYDGVKRLEVNPDFVLNQSAYTGATILLAGPNFGCGSSREHAVWAIADYGFRVIIAPSFGAIFQGNCIRNGLLPVELPAEQVAEMAAWVSAAPLQHQLAVDLVACEVQAADGRVWPFTVPEVARSRLLEGRDEIAETLTHAPALAAWRERDRVLRPWVYAGEG